MVLFFGIERCTQILELLLELNSGVERYTQILELLRSLNVADASELKIKDGEQAEVCSHWLEHNYLFYFPFQRRPTVKNR
jgi:hypothetical protein